MRASRRPSWQVLFPLASLQAALMVPLSLVAMRLRPNLLPGLSTPSGHGRELLFGFALAVVAGYGWLGAGMGALGIARMTTWPTSTALHAVTVGALGILASGIMLRQAIVRARGCPESEPVVVVVALLFSLAAAFRLGWVGAGGATLWGAALAWSLGWLLVTWRLLRWRRWASG